MKYGLKESTIQRINAVFARHPQIQKVVLYGSRAKGSFKNGSDIDLTLRGRESLTPEVLSKILHELDELLLPYTIDLSLYAQIQDPDVLDHIKRVGIIFYKKEGGNLESKKRS